MLRFRLIPFSLALGLPWLLSGCDLLVAGQFMPGLALGVGAPLTGQVLDSRTALPVGGASIASGLGTTLTDAQGNFKLYGNLSSHDVSVSRAGYTNITQGGLRPNPSTALSFSLDPLFPTSQSLATGFLDLHGTVFLGSSKTVALKDGLVCFEGDCKPISNGTYDFPFQSQTPGSMLSGVIGVGTLNTSSQAVTDALAPFFFTTFSYQLGSWKLGGNFIAGATPWSLNATGDVPLAPTQIRYSNLAGYASVKTEISLDFGLAGTLLVARALGSSQTINIPVVSGLKYVVTGIANDGVGAGVHSSSTVLLTTNDPSQAPIALLQPPHILGPTPGASHVGAHPTFSWQGIPVPGIVYQVTLLEGDPGQPPNAKPKWIGSTTDTSITYPSFAANDVNGGALRPEKQYTWELSAIDDLSAGQSANGARSLKDVQPLRDRKREVDITGATFTL